MKMAHRSKQVEKERHDNKVYSLVKFWVMTISYFFTYFTCNDYYSLCLGFFVMSITIGSDMLIILLTTEKSSRQFNVSYFTMILALVITSFYLFSSAKFISFDMTKNIFMIGKDFSVQIPWKHVKFINMIIMFLLIGTYSLEHTGILKMPQHAGRPEKEAST